MVRRVLIPVALGVAAVSGACSSRFGAPDPATTQGAPVLRLWKLLLFVAVALGVVVVGLILWSLVRYRLRASGRAGGREASTVSENVPLELFYTAVPLAIVMAIFGLALVAQRDVTRLVAEPDLRIEVTGFQWGWRFRYLTEGITIVGTSNREPTLVLPVDATARLTLVSNDVVHSFFVPNFLEKRDLIPGVENRIDITPSRTGRFPGVCAEFCGLDHTHMTFVVEVVEPQQFENFLTEQRETGTVPDENDQGGEGEPGSQAAPARRDGGVSVGVSVG
ncbi:MAG: cytochrome c oxidase subunit II [Acidimicrobiales bacterium]